MKPSPDVLSFDFDGDTYEPVLDRARLQTQLQRVHELMLDGRWRTLKDIADAVGGTEASVSARLRDLRKAPFFLLVARERIAGGLFKYCVGRKDSEYPD